MSDQCGRCELRAKLHDCLREDCFQHDNWFALALQEQLAEKDKEIKRLKEQNDNILLGAVKACYLKHHLNSDKFGWNEISDILQNALCNAMGEKGYQDWVATVKR